ncbi:hypothetical protein MNBD_CHLOROFLEXI01-3841 [hydrothermal vent metagenome]|uniref:Methyltransferase domain-containing protein n=1 Tax=hydrothermal vent metagenome TaxID=652676 RepID=A0A3B0VCW5_9ZZZZ
MTNDSNLDMYADPINYDLESGQFKLDDTILLDLASQASGAVLELGCGTGRVTIPLAQQGFDMTGLDITSHMLQYAQNKAKDLPIKWICADIRNFHLENQYALIYTYGSVFQHLLNRSDQEAMLARVHEHLAPEGKFVMDVGFKHPKSMVNVPEKQDWYTFIDDKGGKVQVSGTDHFDHLQQIWYQTLYRHWPEADEPKQAQPERLALRYIMPQEIEALLFYNGFTVLSRYGDWKGNPLTEDSYSHIYVCTKRQ